MPFHLMGAEQKFRSSQWWVIFLLNQLVLKKKKKKKKDEHEEVQAIKEAACSLTMKSGSLMLFSKDDPP